MSRANTPSLSRALDGHKMTRPQRSLPERAEVGNPFGFCEKMTGRGNLPARSVSQRRGKTNSLRRYLMFGDITTISVSTPPRPTASLIAGGTILVLLTLTLKLTSGIEDSQY